MRAKKNCRKSGANELLSWFFCVGCAFLSGGDPRGREVGSTVPIVERQDCRSVRPLLLPGSISVGRTNERVGRRSAGAQKSRWVTTVRPHGAPLSTLGQGVCDGPRWVRGRSSQRGWRCNEALVPPAGSRVPGAPQGGPCGLLGPSNRVTDCRRALT